MSENSTLTVKRVINSKPESIFKALTDQKIMEKWFFAGPDGWSATVKSKASTGEKYQIDMHGEDDTYTHTGEFKEVVPNKKLVFTWNSKSVQNTVVTITLKEKEKGTEVTLVHEFLPNEEMVKNHTEGWKAILERLNQVVTR